MPHVDPGKVADLVTAACGLGLVRVLAAPQVERRELAEVDDRRRDRLAVVRR